MAKNTEETKGKFGFTIEKKIENSLARVGVIHTPHGDIETPAFIVVGTKATVKGLTPEQVRALGAQAVLSNTYHLYLKPGDELVRDAGGLHKFMDWDGPTFTDSGGFQVFSLGAAFGIGVTKIATDEESNIPEVTKKRREGKQDPDEDERSQHEQLARVDDDGVTFKSHIDGSTHRFTPERSIQIQHNIGADIIVAFDECTSPLAPYDDQKVSLDRTHAWAERSLAEHKRLGGPQALYGVIQGGKYKDLREEAATTLGAMDFDGYGIGGSFTKDDIGTAVAWVNSILPEGKPRHLLGIGEPIDMFLGVESGCDTFDCVAATRIGRNGSVYTKDGRINLNNTKFKTDFTPIDATCECFACTHCTRAYISYLFSVDEMLASSLGSIHNLHFIVTLVANMRKAMLDGSYQSFKDQFLAGYYKSS